ncbi:MAG: hypothetical protein Q8Q23_02000 [bacterium]|nr:hypothetical protein [bacterium]
MNTKNIKWKYDHIVTSFTNKLKQKDEVVGIVLLGGVGKRDFLDEYSDIDISVFLEKVPAESYLPPFSFHIHLDGVDVEFNLSQQIMTEEFKTTWNDEKKYAYANGIIVYEHEGLITELLKHKLQRDKKKDFNRLVEIVNQYYWRVNFHSVNSFHRGYPESAHLLINDGLNLLLEALFILNEQEMPHHKWIFRQLEQLNYLSQQDIDCLRDALLVGSYELNSINERITMLDMLKSSIITQIKKHYPEFPEDPYHYWASYLSKRQIFEKTFADHVVRKLQPHLTCKEIVVIRGFISFNLISTKAGLLKCLNNENRSPYLDEPLVSKVKTLVIDEELTTF